MIVEMYIMLDLYKHRVQLFCYVSSLTINSHLRTWLRQKLKFSLKKPLKLKIKSKCCHKCLQFMKWISPRTHSLIIITYFEYLLKWSASDNKTFILQTNRKTSSSQTATSRTLQWDQNTPHNQPNNSNGYLNEILKFKIL